MRLILMLWVMLLPGAPLQAGAWLRGEGGVFVSSSFTLNARQANTSGTYLEYGLRPDMTLGFDVQRYTDAGALQGGTATAFLRRPLGSPDRKSVWSYEIGLGAGWKNDLVTPHLKTGLSWGRGFQLRDRGGWMNVDAAVFWPLDAGTQVAKLDTTVGLNFTDATTGMVQLYLAHIDRELFATLAPSLVYKPKGRDWRIQIGTESPLDAPDATSIKLGLWREF